MRTELDTLRSEFLLFDLSILIKKNQLPELVSNLSILICFFFCFIASPQIYDNDCLIHESNPIHQQ